MLIIYMNIIFFSFPVVCSAGAMTTLNNYTIQNQVPPYHINVNGQTDYNVQYGGAPLTFRPADHVEIAFITAPVVLSLSVFVSGASAINVTMVDSEGGAIHAPNPRLVSNYHTYTGIP